MIDGVTVAVDCETTGVDHHHGAKPFFVTMYDGSDKETYWEWDVDPETREPIIPPEEKKAIRAIVEKKAKRLVLQNAKFDAAALTTIIPDLDWQWDKTYDTLLGAHLLESNMALNLTSLVRHYLKRNIKPLEEKLKKACNEARSYCRRKLPSWRIAKEGLPDMPSAKSGKKKKVDRGAEDDSPWKFDTWVPRQLAKHLWECGEENFAPPVDENRFTELGRPAHYWWTVLRDYSNADSFFTYHLWPVMEKTIRSKKLEKLYEVRRKLLPITFSMEQYGITISKGKARALRDKYLRESNEADAVCKGIAARYGYDLEMPKGGANNKSLKEFCFGRDVFRTKPNGERVWVRKDKLLDLPVRKRTKTGEPSLDKFVMEDYSLTLEKGTEHYEFTQALAKRKSRGTGLGYLASYERFWIPLDVFNEKGEQLWFRMFPSLNPTGTNTLRWSSSNPNEQQISKKKEVNQRKAFGPPPGYEWYSCDAQNIELRIPFYECGEEEMVALFERPNDPPYFGSNHTLIAHVLHKELFEQCLSCMKCGKEILNTEPRPKVEYCRCVGKKEMLDGRIFKDRFKDSWYQKVKNGNFAVQYGAIDRPDGMGTADRAYGIKGAQTIIKHRFKKLTGLNDYWITYANKHGYVETMPDRTVDPERGYPLSCTRTLNNSILPTVPLNYHVQGTACWWMMKAMIRCHEQLAEWNRHCGRDDYRMIMQVHDELVFQMPKKANPKLTPLRSNLGRVRLLQRLMAKGGEDIGIPTPVSAEYHDDNWSDGIAL